MKKRKKPNTEAAPAIGEKTPDTTRSGSSVALSTIFPVGVDVSTASDNPNSIRRAVRIDTRSQKKIHFCPVKSMKSRIMYIERKGNEISGPARVGRVTFSKSGKSLYYNGRRFHTLAGSGFKANYFDWETEEHYWISGCKKRGG
jgi:hypothetical protein